MTLGTPGDIGLQILEANISPKAQTGVGSTSCHHQPGLKTEGVILGDF